MKLSRVLTKAISFLYYLVKFKDYHLAFRLSHSNIPLKKCAGLERKGDYLLSTKTGNKIPVHAINKFFSDGLIYVIELLNHKDVESIKEAENGIIITTGGVALNVHSTFNIGTFYEIFIRKTYDYYSSHNNITVVDIGMNAGYASLFFASMPNVKKVYSYEPFAGTYNAALQNFESNPSIKTKIKAFNKGVTNQTGQVDVPLFDDDSPEASISSDFINSTVANIGARKTIQVEVIDIEDILKEITKDESNPPLILKIDCEGEEYNIIDKLNVCGQLKNISGFLIEWHQRGPKEIVDKLIQNNFQVFHSSIIESDGGLHAEAGMIYAFK